MDDADKLKTIFGPGRWALSVGIILGVTLMAFEALAVVTVAPGIAASLDGRALYGWTFSGFFLASLLATVIAGDASDRRGPLLPLALALPLFGAGLLVSAAAPNMPLFILGRALQGLGGGALTVCLYVAINLVYPDELRPRMMALVSSAWILPALLGPSLAGLLADLFGWRSVFWAVLPLLVVAAVLALPAFRGLGNKGDAAGQNRLLPAAALAIGAGVFLAALSQPRTWLAPPLVLLGALPLVWGLRRVTPAGTLQLSRGLPALLAARGLFYAAFVGIEAFLALALTEVHGFSGTLTGAAIAAGSLSWTAGSWAQDRLDSRLADANKFAGRRRRILIGCAVLACGVAAQFGALYTDTLPLLATILAWATCGFGIGLAHATSSVLAFKLAPEGGEGAVSSALQIADTFTSAMSAGIGGALLALAGTLAWSTQSGVALAFAVSAAAIVLALVSAYRVGPQDAVPDAAEVRRS